MITVSPACIMQFIYSTYNIRPVDKLQYNKLGGLRQTARLGGWLCQTGGLEALHVFLQGENTLNVSESNRC
jgi:hypothetical protein